MIYTQLSTNYKYDVIANAIYAREIEYFHYDFDRINFEYLLTQLPNGPYRTDIKTRLSNTIKQMHNVSLIIDALRSQIDDETAYNAAVERMTAKRATENTAALSTPTTSQWGG
jgi:predicted unusual protein kinase regulating ubiquinone biosynthesis (AarF/ABC1/UbiB family)